VTGFGGIGKLGHLNGYRVDSGSAGFVRNLAADCEPLRSTAGFELSLGPEVVRGSLFAARCRSSPDLGAPRIIGRTNAEPATPSAARRWSVGQGDCAIRRGFTKTGVGGQPSQEGQLLPEVPATVGCT
jgi:hypothetical protein